MGEKVERKDKQLRESLIRTIIKTADVTPPLLSEIEGRAITHGWYTLRAMRFG